MGATARRRRRRRRTIINNILIIILIIQDGGHTQADHYSGHQRILSNWTFADICDIWRWTHWTSIIHVMVNWHLSKQGIRWPVSRDHIAGSCWVLIEVSCFFQVNRWPGTGFQLDRRLKLSQNEARRLHQVNIFTVLYGRRYSCLGGIRFWKNPFFLHFRRF